MARRDTAKEEHEESMKRDSFEATGGFFFFNTVQRIPPPPPLKKVIFQAVFLEKSASRWIKRRHRTRTSASARVPLSSLCRRSGRDERDF